MSNSATILLVGHELLLAKLLSQVEQDKLHQAILLSGPSGIGKILIAKKIAQSLMCQALKDGGAPCEQCGGCRMVMSGNHPDLFFYDPASEEQASVDALRELLRNLSLTSMVGGKKVVLIDNADNMSVSAANIFLKGLEEPRPSTHFILVSSNPYKLPVTIRSRVQGWRFNKLEETQVRKILSEKTGRMDFDTIVRLCDGSLSAANDLLENNELISDLTQMVTDIITQEAAKAFIMASKLAKDKEQLRTALPVLCRVTRMKLTELVENTEVEDTDSFEVCSRLAGFMDDCQSAEYALFERNINPLLVLNDIVARGLGVGMDKGLSRTAAASSLSSYF